jgi:MFS family permease
MSVTSTALPSRLRSRRGSHPGVAVLAVASVTRFLVVLDVTIINVALPQMRAALHMSTAGQQWAVNANALTFAGLLMLGGRAADLFARKRVFLIGLAGFSLLRFLGGLAQSSGELIAARAADRGRRSQPRLQARPADRWNRLNRRRDQRFVSRRQRAAVARHTNT